MKLQVTQENLSKALNITSRIASSRSTLPILSNIMLSAEKNRLLISSTNLDIAIKNNIGAKVTNEGSITVPARLMQDFISSLPPGNIDLSTDDNKLNITTDQYKSTINGTSSEEFPVMPAITTGDSWSIEAKELKHALQQVAFAASTDEARQVLTGVYFYTEDGKLFAVSTDSYRLAEKELIKTNKDIKLLVPSSAMQELLRVISDDDGQVEVVGDSQQAKFNVGNIELVTRLIEGNYPDYKKLIPSKFATKANAEKSEFANITKVSSLFARENAGSVTIKVGENKISIRSIASQLGENEANASAKTTGEGEITLNSRYLLDALSAIGGEKVELGFNGKLEPSVLRDPSKPDYVHIVMPLKS